MHQVSFLLCRAHVWVFYCCSYLDFAFAASLNLSVYSDTQKYFASTFFRFFQNIIMLLWALQHASVGFEVRLGGDGGRHGRRSGVAEVANVDRWHSWVNDGRNARMATEARRTTVVELVPNGILRVFSATFADRLQPLCCAVARAIQHPKQWHGALLFDELSASSCRGVDLPSHARKNFNRLVRSQVVGHL